MHTKCPVRYMLWIAACCAVLLAGCAGRASVPAEPAAFAEATPAEARAVLRALDPARQGLASWRDLAPAVRASLDYAASKTPEDIAMAQDALTVTWSEVRASLRLLDSLLPRLDREPELLLTRFRWLRLQDGAHFSGYYEAEVNASRTRSAAFPVPLYARPTDLRTARLGDFDPDWLGLRLAYRLGADGAILPYYTRAEIDNGVLAGQGLELAWVADPTEAFFLQLQGSGKLRFADGTTRNVLYDGDNGRPYTSLGRYLCDQGLIAPAAVSMQSIRAWLAAHPERRDAVLRVNARYVFFRLADGGLVGAMGRGLTPRVSLAVDRTVFPLGGVLLFRTPFPGSADGLTGLGLAQDTGGAIKNRRLDLFCGSGADAGAVAGRLNAAGEAWLLLAR